MAQNAAKTRIFLVENDRGFLERWSKILERLDYDVAIFLVQKPNQLHECVAVAETFRPHVAMIDLRLENDLRLSDTSGVELLALLKGKCPTLEAIIYSAHLEWEVDRQITKLGGDIFKKGAAPKVLVERIAEAANKTAVSASDKSIVWPDAWELADILKQVLEESFESYEQKHYPIPNDLVHQLYPNAKLVTISHLEGRVAMQPSPISHGRSFVAALEVDNKPIKDVLKITTVDRIEIELENYQTYIEGNIPRMFHTQLINSAVFWDIGASVYSLVGHNNLSFRSFLEFFQQNDDITVLIKPVRYFFEKVWNHHYQGNNKLLDCSLYDEYADKFDLPAKFRDFDLEQLFPHFGPLANLTNPVKWLQNNQEATHFPARQAIIHGDFHCDNIFTDDTYLWVIDFERTGWSHILRDFCELEGDLTVRAISNTHLPIRPFCALAAQLAGITPPAHYKNSPEVHKLLDFALALRQLAKKVTGSEQDDEYYAGLFFNALYMALRKVKDSSEIIERQRAWIYASLLCDRLMLGSNSNALPPHIEQLFSNNFRQQPSL